MKGWLQGGNLGRDGASVEEGDQEGTTKKQGSQREPSLEGQVGTEKLNASSTVQKKPPNQCAHDTGCLPTSGLSPQRLAQ